MVYATVIIPINLSNPTDCISCSVPLKLPVICIQNCERFEILCSSFIAKVKNIIQDLEYYENDEVPSDNVDDYDYQARARLGTLVDRQHREQRSKYPEGTRLGKCDVFIVSRIIISLLVFARGRNNHISFSINIRSNELKHDLYYTNAGSSQNVKLLSSYTDGYPQKWHPIKKKNILKD